MPSHAQSVTDPTFFITDDGAFSAWLPEGWYASGDRDRGLLIIQDEDGLDIPQTVFELKPDQFNLYVSLLTDSLRTLFDLTDDDSPHDVLAGMLAYGEDTIGDGAQLTPVTESEYFDRTIATATMRSDEVESMYFAWYLAPNEVGIASFDGVSGSLNQFGKQAIEILLSIRYALPLEQSHEAAIFTLQYPADWLVEETVPNTAFAITNDPEAVDTSELVAGQFGVVLLDTSIFGLSGDVADVAAQLGELVIESDQELGDTVVLNIDGTAVGFVEILAPDSDANEGGIYVVQSNGQSAISTIYVASHGDAYQIGLTGLNILLSVE
jgi:hypothetical protein